MDIRQYKNSDTKAVIFLWDTCNVLVTSNNPKQDIARKLAVDPDLFLIGEIDGIIVATVMGGYEGHRGWINYLAVHPEYQRNGFGKRIMLEIENRLKMKGCPKINVQIRATNENVISFYQKIGFLDDNVIGLGKRLFEDEKFIS
ncbi:MAG: GNAT family acetyltransferase [Thiohalomonadales bacterium]